MRPKVPISEGQRCVYQAHAAPADELSIKNSFALGRWSFAWYSRASLVDTRDEDALRRWHKIEFERLWIQKKDLRRITHRAYANTLFARRQRGLKIIQGGICTTSTDAKSLNNSSKHS